MIGKLRFEPPDHFFFDGYPDGSRVCGLALPHADELRRLFLFQKDLRDSVEWLESLGQFPIESPIREALAVAALIRFFGCFESTAGHRRKPLQRKKLFEFAERSTFDVLKRLRDKLVVHDEQLYPNHTPWVVIGPEGSAIEAGVLGMGFRLADMIQAEQLLLLAGIALTWAANEFELVASQVVDNINKLPADVVLQLVDAAGPLKIQITNED